MAGQEGGKRIAVLGGGAAGLMAAVVAARAGAQVSVYEAADRVGKSILVTGNGRCNLDNLEVLPLRDYNEPEFAVAVQAAAGGFAPYRFFQEELGLFWQADGEGRVYPQSNKAATVLNVLRLELEHLDVPEICDFRVCGIDVCAGSGEQGCGGDGCGARFILHAQDGRSAQADGIIVASGGGSNDIWRLLGQPCRKCRPVLAPLATETAALKGLSGIRCAARISLNDAAGRLKAQEEGELLFRDYGVSGIMVFNLSRFAQAGDMLSIDFFPAWEKDALAAAFERRAQALSWMNASAFLEGAVDKRLGQAILRQAGIALDCPVGSLDMERLMRALTSFELQVTGIAEPKQAQVKRGGALLDGFDAASLESKLLPGVFGAGEALDMDGRCGGYNLHWAWLSGYVAARSAAGSGR